jgi:hypothetical protein
MLSLTEAPRQDQPRIIVDYEALVNVPKVDAQDLKRVQLLYKA